jgi:hypothetical protein
MYGAITLFMLPRFEFDGRNKEGKSFVYFQRTEQRGKIVCLFSTDVHFFQRAASPRREIVIFNVPFLSIGQRNARQENSRGQHTQPRT